MHLPISTKHYSKWIYFFILFTAKFSFGQCDSVAGPMNPATASDQAFTGSNYAFTNPSNVFVSDNNYAIAAAAFTLFLFSGKTDYLMATNFDFNIPLGATICGISVDIQKSATNIVNLFSRVEDNTASLLKNNVLTGNNEAATSVPWSTANTWSAYGGNSDSWGTTWTPEDINSPNFGVAVSAMMTGTIALEPAARIDNITITAYYSYSLLPLELSSFRVNPTDDGSAVISWTSEINKLNTRFVIERSAEGDSWESLDSLSPIMQEGISKSYSYTDMQPLPGNSYYRIVIYNQGVAAYISLVQPFYLPVAERLLFTQILQQIFWL